MTQLWKLEAEGPAATMQAALERLEALDPAPALSLSLFERAGGAARLEALFDAAPDTDAVLRQAGLEANALSDLHAGPLSEEDWVALSLQGLKPVSAGRFFVHGSHDSAEGAVPILIEANQAFGTGHHGTTKGCLLAFDAMLSAGREFSNVLDLGCGAGTLAIAAARTSGAAIAASDNDPLAVRVTDENLAANGVADRVRTVTAEGLDSPDLQALAPYDLVFANILAGPLIGLARDVAQITADGGRVILSGLLTGQRSDVQTAYENAGFTLESAGEIDGWSTLVMRRA